MHGKKKIKGKVPRQKENTSVKQSPDEMKNEAEHVQNQETGSTSRPFSCETEEPNISEFADILVREILNRTYDNMKDWDADESFKIHADESSVAHRNERVKRQLKRLYDLRRMFAEWQETPEEVTPESFPDNWMDATPGPSCETASTETTSILKSFLSTCKKMKEKVNIFTSEPGKKEPTCESKRTWSRWLTSESGKNKPLAKEQDLDDSARSESSDLFDNVEHEDAKPEAEKVPQDLIQKMDSSDCASPKGMSPTASVISSENIMTAEEKHLSFDPLEVVDKVQKIITPETKTNSNNLVTDMDATPKPSLEVPGAEKFGSDNSVKTSEDTNLPKPEVSESTNNKSTGKGYKNIFTNVATACKKIWRPNKSKLGKKDQPTEEQDLDNADMSESTDTKSVSPCPEDASPTPSVSSTQNMSAPEQADLSSVPLESVDKLEQEIITPETEEISKVTQVPVVTQEAEKVPQDLVQKMDSSDCASPKRISPTASVVSSENIVTAEEKHLSFDPLELVDKGEQEIITPESKTNPHNLVTDMDATPEPSLEVPGAEKFGSNNSVTTSEDTNLPKPEVSKRTNKKSTGKGYKKIFEKVPSSRKNILRPNKSKPGKKNQPAEEQDLDNADMSESTDTKSVSPCPEDASPTPSVSSTQNMSAPEQADLSFVPLESVNNLVQEIITPETEKIPQVTQVPIVTQEAEKVPQDLILNMDSSDCASPKGISPTASVVSSENIVTAEEKHLSFDPLELVDKVEQEIIPPETEKIPQVTQVQIVTQEAEKVPQDLVPNMNSSDCASPKGISPTASVVSSEHIVTAEEKHLSFDPLEMVDKVEKKIIRPETEKIPQVTQVPIVTQEVEKVPQDLVPNMNSSDCASPKGISPTASVVSSENIVTAEEKHLSFDPLELVDKVEQEIITPETEKIPQVTQVPIVTQEAEKVPQDLILNMDSSDCASPKGISPTASVVSSENIVTAEEKHLSFDPLEMVDKVEKKIIRPETEKIPQVTQVPIVTQEAEKVPEDLVPNMDSSDCASPKGMSPTASVVSSENIVTAEEKHLSFDPLELVDKVEQEIITPETEKVPQVTQVPIVTQEAEKVPQDLVPNTDSSDCASPKGISPTASVGFSVNTEAAKKADPSSDSQEQVSVEKEDVTPEGDEVIALKPFNRGSSPPADHNTERSSEKDLVRSDSTPGTSEQDRHPEGPKEDNEAAVLAQFNGLKIIVYNIIKGFFDSLTEKQRTEMRKGVYNTDVKKNLGGMCVELLRIAIETVTDTVSQAMNQPATPHGTLTERKPTLSQKLPSETNSELVVLMEQGLQQSLTSIFDQAYSEVIAETAVTPKFTTTLIGVITDEVNSVLSETTQGFSSVGSATCCRSLCCRACRKMMVVRVLKSLLTQFKTRKHSDCEKKDDRSTDEYTTQAHIKKGPWWSGVLKRPKNRVYPVSDGQKDSISSDELISSGRSSKVYTPLELVNYEDDTSDNCLSQLDSEHEYTSEDDENNTPPHAITKEDEVIVPDNQESPILCETQTEDQKKDPTKPSLLRRIWLFCCRRSRSDE